MSYRGFQSTNSDEEHNDWSRLSLTLASNVQKISQNINQIQRLINELQTSEDSENLRTQLHNMQERTAQLTRDTNSCLKELAELPQLVESSISGDQNRRNPLMNSLNASNIRKTIGKQFSVEKFMTPSSLVSKKSNFYEGKTVFGGANTSRAARLAGATPYNLLQRHHLAPVVRVNIETSKRLVESSEPLSSSSQRILEKLEKASTPLQDARRMPSSAHLKSYFQTSDLLHRSSKRPKLGAIPVFNQKPNDATPFQTKHWELRLSNRDDHKISATETTDRLINSCDNKYLIDSNETFSGKIMRKDNRREEKRLNTQIPTNGEKEELNLLTSAQPLKMPSSLPKFNFGSKPSVKSPLTTVITKAEPQDLEFKFSEPLLKIRDQKSEAVLQTGRNGRKPFVFSSPLSAITHKSSNNSDKIEKKSNIFEQSNKSDKIIQPLSKGSIHSDTNVMPTLIIETNAETPKNEKSDEKWICVCLFQNISSDNKCKACNKERSSQIRVGAPPSKTTIGSNMTKTCSVATTQNSSIGWGNSFKPSSGSWSCSVCLVSNPSDKVKCMACEEPKPGAKPPVNASIGWGNNFKPPTDSWSCTVCLVSNPLDKVKCMACEEPKPGNNLPLSRKDTLKHSSEEWQCFYCKHNNEMSKTSCTSCFKIKTPIATKADLDKLYGGQTFKFGITEEKTDSKTYVSETIKSNEGKTDIFKPSLKSNESTPQTTTSNAFVFGTSSEEKNKLSTDSNAFKPNDLSGLTPVFKFGVPTDTSKLTSEVKPTEKSNTNIDIFGLNKVTNNSFSFGTPPTTASSTSDNPLKASSESTSLFLFGAQNKEDDSLKNKKNVSFELQDKSKSSEVIPNKSVTDSTAFGFQLPKSSEDKPNIFKSFNSSPIGSLFGSTTTSTNTSVTTVTTVSITSFLENKFTSKPNESQTKSVGSLFGAPTTTTSFSSPFSLINSFGSGQKSTPITGQTKVIESNETKSLFSLTPSSTIKSFDSLISSQTNPLSSVSTPSSATPTAALSLSNSSSPSKSSLVFGNSNPSLQSFSSQSSTATTKPNFSFNLSANKGSTTATSTTDSGFSTSTNTLFTSNPNNSFNFGNSALNSTQTPAFSFANPSSNPLSNTSSNLKFGLNANPINTTTNSSADTNSKPATNSLFTFGGQNSDQFSNSLTQKPLNNTNINSKTSSQFSFGLSSNTSTGQTNSNLFANAINSGQNSLSFNQMAPTAAPTATPSPFTFGGFGSNQTTPAMPQMQTRPQQPQPAIPPPSFNFSAQPTFDFTSLPNAGPPSGGPVFQFSAEQTSQSVAPNRNIKKAKRRLNPT